MISFVSTYFAYRSKNIKIKVKPKLIKHGQNPNKYNDSCTCFDPNNGIKSYALTVPRLEIQFAIAIDTAKLGKRCDVENQRLNILNCTIVNDSEPIPKTNLPKRYYF